MKITVLMGGPSEEHAISLKSGHGVADALAQRGWAVEPVVLPRDMTIEEACAHVRRAILAGHPDVVFLALHGQFGEDGTIQQVCEELPVAYVGSGPEASLLGMDKIASRKVFERAGLPVPKWCAADAQSLDLQLLKGWTYPLVVKPSDQGSSIGVSLARTPRDLPAAAAAAGQFGREVVIEEFIEGREVTAGVLGETALPVVEIRPHQAFFDFTAKYTVGATDYLVPAPLPEEVAGRIQAVGLKAHRVLGCRHLSRSDLILRPDGVPVLLELNTLPGFTPTSLLPKAAAHLGISYEELCEQLVLMAAQPLARRAPVER
ncbi:MAG: D-alanine--D-alanine ligase [Candidatus Omnitrophica bacterium]|nr:D-alanine--D-alanine ligase [Candidatus Omnitrophota bacterium]